MMGPLKGSFGGLYRDIYIFRGGYVGISRALGLQKRRIPYGSLANLPLHNP